MKPPAGLWQRLRDALPARIPAPKALDTTGPNKLVESAKGYVATQTGKAASALPSRITQPKVVLKAAAPSKLLESAKGFVVAQTEKAASSAKNGVSILQQKATSKLQDARDHVASSTQYLKTSSQNKLRQAGTAVVDASRQTLERTGSSIIEVSKTTVQSAQDRVAKASAGAFGATTDAVRAGASTLQRRVVETVDPRETARKLRNQVLLLVFSGIFVYGFASAIPPAVSKYLIEKERLAEQHRHERSHESSS
ncbi:hypothetical protein ACHHYP_02464 [Achlya hypogyna]|uniref:Uncharacterized protein n=1 Tax=Achlya hypogyna TaxID=1202772 RepID=A0A1V9Z699_ACHHY|nr:hypothetical protein ACHHYP_02464 [Achlya hypogyna]